MAVFVMGMPESMAIPVAGTRNSNSGWLIDRSWSVTANQKQEKHKMSSATNSEAKPGMYITVYNHIESSFRRRITISEVGMPSACGSGNILPYACYASCQQRITLTAI